MAHRLDKAFAKAETNIYKHIKLKSGSLLFVWTLLCLYLVNRDTRPVFVLISGGIYYLSLLIISLIFFKDIKRYLRFPGKESSIPVFIGHKADVVFTYPLMLMAVIGLVSNTLPAAGILPPARQQADMTNAAAWVMTARIILMPLVAYAEELLNLLLVSFLFRYVKLPGKFRLVGSILAAAAIFGLLHTFGWGIEAAIPVGIAYIPVFAATLYTGNIWISFMAHLYNDLIVFSKNNYGSLHIVVIAAITVIPALWALWSLFRKKS